MPHGLFMYVPDSTLPDRKHKQNPRDVVTIVIANADLTMIQIMVPQWLIYIND